MVVIYTTNSVPFIPERIKQAEEIINSIPAKHVFITGSFLYSKKYNDIDVIIITRSKKKFSHPNKLVQITKVDFNVLYSPIHHSMTKLCVSKNILPTKPVKATISTFWTILTNSVVYVWNEPELAKKDLRSFILYANYFSNNEILDSFQLKNKTNKIASLKKLFAFIDKYIPEIIRKNCSQSYIERFFYSESAFRSELDYFSKSESYFKSLSLSIIHSIKNGQCETFQENSKKIAISK